MEECVFSGDDESQLTSVSYTPRSGEFELSEGFVILENEDKCLRSRCHTYEISASFFCRMLSLVYFFSFISNINQVLGLFGTAGMYDAASYSFLQSIASKSFYEAITEFPSLFLILPISDFTLRIVPFIGITMSFIMFLTGFNCMYSFLVLWVLKLSLVALFRSVPKTVSDLLLLEVGFLAIFIFSPFKFFDKHLSLDLPALVKWSFRLLSYRVVLLSGLYKIFLKLNFQHILTSIPLPTFFTHFLTRAVAKHSFLNTLLTLVLLFYEVVLSVFIVTPHRSCRLFGGMALMVYASVFTLLGNFGPFYILLLMTSLFCLDDQFLHPFTQWKFNPFSKSDTLMKKVSIDLIESLTDSGDCVDTVDTHCEGVDTVDPVDTVDNELECNTVRSIECTEDTFGSVYIERILSNLSYNRHREYLRDFMNLDNLSVSDLFKKILTDLLFLLYITLILILLVLLLLFPHYKGVKSLILFLVCVLLKSHCEAVRTKISLLQGEYTLFLLQSILTFEMVKNGPNTWSFLLWIGLIELQINLSKKMDNMHHLTKMIIQSFLFIHLIVYSARVFQHSVTEILTPQSLNTVNTTNTMSNGNSVNSVNSMNNFYSVSNYRNVFRVGSERYELVIEGTNESVVTTRTHWEEYYFKRKPSKLDQFPHLTPFYQYFLDDILVQSFNLQYNNSNSNSNSSSNRNNRNSVRKKKYIVSTGDTGDTGDSVESTEDSVEGTVEGTGDTVKSVNGDELPYAVTEKFIFDLLRMLLMGSGEVKNLMYNPFEGTKPKYTRVLLYKYYFSSLHTVNSKNWYYRNLVTELIPPLYYNSRGTLSQSHNTTNYTNYSPNSTVNTVNTVSSRENRVNRENRENREKGDRVDEMVHMVHVIPASSHPGVPLDMADSFNHKVPNVDGIIITSK